MFAGMRKSGNNKGQIAIFLLLIFQLLFVLFAMTLNIALTVHDKINLQNSVDLAAIYGAKKQAEVLNAIAHINYQMRQNYKLLAWRYRILGSMTQMEGIPSSNSFTWCPKPKPPGVNPSPYYDYNCTIPHDDDPCNTSPYSGYCDSNFTVCLSSDIWERGISPTHQNLCTNQKTTIPAPLPVPIIAGFLPINAAAAASQIAFTISATQSCKAESLINWLTAHLFLSQFRLDQKDRKMMIQAIYNATLKEGQDLDGESIEEGARKTFEKNLTWVNKQNFSPAIFKTFNPLEDKEFDDSDPLLQALNIFPSLEYLYFGSSSGTLCSNLGHMYTDDDPAHSSNPFLLLSTSDPVIANYRAFVTQWNWLFRHNAVSAPTETFISPLTLGYTKNPAVRVYYGVSVVLPHQSVHQLFSPFSSTPLTLKASAFAKPFGGRIGPKKDKDKLIEPQIDVLSSGALRHQWNMKPNYTRFPGDNWGLIHREAHRGGPNDYYLHKKEGWDGGGSNPFSVNHYADLTNRDPLAANAPGPSGGNHLFILRMMELMALSPDLFDVLNYSISNNYMDTYFPKICKLIGQGGNNCNPNQVVKIDGSHFSGTPPIEGHIRGDFGYPHTRDYADLNKTHLSNPSPLSPFFFFPDTVKFGRASHNPGFAGHHGLGNKPPYLIRDPAHLLTGFMPTTNPDRYNDYNATGAKPSMKCYEPTPYEPPPNGRHIPSGCAVGGRSGYSIKLISCDIVKSLPSVTDTPTNMDAYCK